jgi:hypothetical protein
MADTNTNCNPSNPDLLIKAVKNNIYFYADITKENILNLYQKN